MAQQSGIIRLKGTIAGITFYKGEEGYMAREKGGVDAKKIASDPAFQRTRENNQEFGAAGKGSKLLRNSIQVLLQNVRDKKVTSRLTKTMLAIIKTDPVNERGERTIVDGNMQLLNGFDFNINGKLSTSLSVPFSCTIDRASGVVSLDLEAFVPTLRINAPAGTTHFRLSLGGAELNFEDKTFVFEMEQTAILPHNVTEVAAMSLSAALPANSILPIVGVVGIEFFQEVNAQMYPLKNGSYNALSVGLLDNNG